MLESTKFAMTRRKISQSQWVLLILIMLVGFGLRFAYLDREMRFDESVTVYQFAAKSIPTIVGDYTWVNNHIFHSLLVHFPYTYLDKSPIFVRLPVFILGIALIPMVFVVGSRFYNRPTGLIAASLVAVYPILIDYSVNARGYMVLSFIVMWMLVLAYDLHQKDDTGKWLLLSLLAALGFFTVPIMLYPMGAIALWLMISIYLKNIGEKRVELFKNYFVSMFLGAILTVILYVPVLYFNLEALQTSEDYEHMRPMPWNDFFAEIPEVFSLMWQHLTWETPLIVLLVLFILMGIGTVFHHQVSRKSLPLLPFFIAWILPVIFIQRVVPFSRTWLFLAPVLLLLSAAGLAFILERFKSRQEMTLALSIGIILLGMSLYIGSSNIIPESDEWVNAPDAEEAAFFLNEIMADEDKIVLMIPYNYPVLYYSAVHDLRFGGDEAATEENVANDSDESYYIYILFPKGEDERFEVESEFNDELKAGGELVFEWEFSILRRTVINGD